MQYDHPNIPNRYAIYGKIGVRAELEGHPEVSLNLMRADGKEQSANILPSISLARVHPCVQQVDLSNPALIRLSFAPPLGAFTLMKYSLDPPPSTLASGNPFALAFPLRGFYQMKEVNPTQVKVLVQIKLQEEVNNDFEYCEIEIPFPNRPPIVHVDLQPTAGTIEIKRNRPNVVVWNIGQKFTARNLEAACPGTVTFATVTSTQATTGHHEGHTPVQSTHTTLVQTAFSSNTDSDDDPFCTGPNAYIKVRSSC